MIKKTENFCYGYFCMALIELCKNLKKQRATNKETTAYFPNAQKLLLEDALQALKCSNAVEVLEAEEKSFLDNLRGNLVELSLPSLTMIKPNEVLEGKESALSIDKYIEIAFYNNKHLNKAELDILQGAVNFVLIQAIRNKGEFKLKNYLKKAISETAVSLRKLFLRHGWLNKKTLELTNKGAALLSDASYDVLDKYSDILEDLLAVWGAEGNQSKLRRHASYEGAHNNDQGLLLEGLYEKSVADFNELIMRQLSDKPTADLPFNLDLCPYSRIDKSLVKFNFGCLSNGAFLQSNRRIETNDKQNVCFQFLPQINNLDVVSLPSVGSLKQLIKQQSKISSYLRGGQPNLESVLNHSHKCLADVSKLVNGAHLTILQEHSVAVYPTDQPELRKLKNSISCLDLLAGKNLISAEAFLIVAAGVGLFNHAPFKRYPHSADFCRLTLHCFEKREYIVRHACSADLPRLYALEELCWQHSKSSKARIRDRVINYPNGQFVIEMNEQVVGVIYSQRINSATELEKAQANNVHKLHTDMGRIIQLLAVNVDPSLQNLNLGDELLEFMLQRCSVTDNVEKVVAITLCKKFSEQNTLKFNEYLALKGANQDPILAFHDSHGADIVKAIPNYRPEDFANQHNGVLVSYEIHNRAATKHRNQVARAEQDSLTRDISLASEFSEKEVLKFVSQEVAQILNMGIGALELSQPLMEMGLDSADLLKLQRLVEQWSRLKLKPGFFFEFNSIDKITSYLSAKLNNKINKSDDNPNLASSQADLVAKSEFLKDNGVTESTYSDMDIAIVGAACKLPGGIESPEELWEVLDTSSNVIGRYPEQRGPWPSDDEYPGISYGGFIQDADAFDAEFFRLSPTEAINADPQQRIMLELSWKCLENANILPQSLKESNTAVFIGASNSDYSRLYQQSNVTAKAHSATGSSLAVIPNRISYFFDLSGPSLLIDTACSSSLVAMHSALLSLRSGECSAALVGGVNLICHSDLSLAYHKAGMLSPDGQCKSFDESANGYVRSEGAVMLMLKPVEKAISDGNDILAVIKGSAVNHGGLAGGLTVPNPKKQSELIISAWQNAQISIDRMDYMEAHGTGTSLGDPIEIQGIQSAYSQLSKLKQPKTCAIGSIKSNLGHLESAAGITGLLKVVLSMKNKKIPASINHQKLNSKIELEGTPFHIAKSEDWKSTAPLVAGVSSFGSGGANAHVVLEEWTAKNPTPVREAIELFVISANTKDALIDYIKSVISWISVNSDNHSFNEFLYSFQVARTVMKYRLALQASDYSDLNSKLQQWLKKPSLKTDRESVTYSPERLEKATREEDYNLIAQMWQSGNNLDFCRLYDDQYKLINIPTYPFTKQRFWIEQPQISPPNKSLEESKSNGKNFNLKKSWQSLPREFQFTQGDFTCLSLGFVIEMLVIAAEELAPFSQIESINDLKYYPFHLDQQNDFDFELNCMLDSNGMKVEIFYTMENENLLIAKANVNSNGSKRTKAYTAESDNLTFDNAAWYSSVESTVDQFRLPLNTINSIFPTLLSNTASPLVTLQKITFYATKSLNKSLLIAVDENQVSIFTKARKPLLTFLNKLTN